MKTKKHNRLRSVTPSLMLLILCSSGLYLPIIHGQRLQSLADRYEGNSHFNFNMQTKLNSTPNFSPMRQLNSGAASLVVSQDDIYSETVSEIDIITDKQKVEMITSAMESLRNFAINDINSGERYSYNVAIYLNYLENILKGKNKDLCLNDSCSKTIKSLANSYKSELSELLSDSDNSYSSPSDTNTTTSTTMNFLSDNTSTPIDLNQLASLVPGNRDINYKYIHINTDEDYEYAHEYADEYYEYTGGRGNAGRRDAYNGSANSSGNMPKGRLSVTQYSADKVSITFWDFASTDDNWIGLYAQGASNDDYIDYKYTGKKSNGSVQFRKLDLEPGTYDVRFFYDDSYDREGSVSFQIGNSIAISSTKTHNLVLPPITPTSPAPVAPKKGRHTVFGGR